MGLDKPRNKKSSQIRSSSHLAILFLRKQAHIAVSRHVQRRVQTVGTAPSQLTAFSDRTSFFNVSICFMALLSSVPASCEDVSFSKRWACNFISSSCCLWRMLRSSSTLLSRFAMTSLKVDTCAHIRCIHEA
eukprot:504255-Rhodomonas_salina.2